MSEYCGPSSNIPHICQVFLRFSNESSFVEWMCFFFAHSTVRAQELGVLNTYFHFVDLCNLKKSLDRVLGTALMRDKNVCDNSFWYYSQVTEICAAAVNRKKDHLVGLSFWDTSNFRWEGEDCYFQLFKRFSISWLLRNYQKCDEIQIKLKILSSI